MKEIQLFPYFLSLLQTSSSILLIPVLPPFADLTASIFGPPIHTEDEYLSRNPLCLKYCIGTSKMSQPYELSNYHILGLSSMKWPLWDCQLQKLDDLGEEKSLLYLQLAHVRQTKCHKIICNNLSTQCVCGLTIFQNLTYSFLLSGDHSHTLPLDINLNDTFKESKAKV